MAQRRSCVSSRKGPSVRSPSTRRTIPATTMSRVSWRRLARRREGDRHAGALRAATRIAASTLDGAGRGHESSARSSALSGADRAPGSRFRGGGRSIGKRTRRAVFLNLERFPAGTASDRFGSISCARLGWSYCLSWVRSRRRLQRLKVCFQRPEPRKPPFGFRPDFGRSKTPVSVVASAAKRTSG